jgi:hypoxanthine phosphoribosyltransferase
MKKHENVDVLYSESDLSKRISELATKIAEDHSDQEVVLVCVLKGAFLFAADLSRAIPSPVAIDFITASSYEGTKSTGQVKISSGSPMDYENRNVIIVEDIVDTGLTIKKLVDEFKKQDIKSIKVASLLSKKASRKYEVNVDYCGFEIDDHFVVGYGLDYNQKFRDLPYIGIYKGD